MAREMAYVDLASELRGRIDSARQARAERLADVALRALDDSRIRLMMAFRFLDRALWKMPFEPGSCAPWPLATNGTVMRFDPAAITDAFRAYPDNVVRAHLHSLLHCIFRHPLHTVRGDPQTWELACDICVESIAVELCKERFALHGDGDIVRILTALEKEEIPLTPAGIYRALLLWRTQPPQNPLLKRLADDEQWARSLFARDSHELWDLAQPSKPGEYQEQPNEPGNAKSNQGDAEAAEGEGDTDDGNGAQPPSARRGEQDTKDDSEPPEGDSNNTGEEREGDDHEEGEGQNQDESQNAWQEEIEAIDDEGARSALSQDDATDSQEIPSELSDASREWERIAERVEAELLELERQHGTSAGRLSNNLTLANRSRIDYADFMRRFATSSEEMVTNDEEFDYLFYTYGLSQYGNVAIVEPLEYKEDRRLREFAIAIDTSGSCSHGLTRAFVTRTYEILSQACGPGERMNVHIIECDAKVQSDTVITCMGDLRAYERDFEIRGFGGTDFRPVFSYVDKLTEDRAFKDLRGLVYFTDGYGTFPERAPDYDVAFVFVERAGKQRRVPPWAMKVIMDEDDLEMLEGDGAWTSAKQSNR